MTKIATVTCPHCEEIVSVDLSDVEAATENLGRVLDDLRDFRENVEVALGGVESALNSIGENR